MTYCNMAHKLNIFAAQMDYNVKELIMCNAFICKLVALFIVDILKCLTFKYSLRPYHLKLMMHCPGIYLSLYLSLSHTSVSMLIFSLII